jgi:hypothetical protein
VEELSFDDLWSALSDDHYHKEVQCVLEPIFTNIGVHTKLHFGRYIGALKRVEKLKDTDLGEGRPIPPW